MLGNVLLQVVGQTAGDRVVISAAWVGLVVLAAIILVAAAATSHGVRR